MNAPINGKYTITKVVQSSAYSPQLGAYATKQIHYRLADGTQGHIEVPHTEYNAETVAQAMDAVVTNHEHVMALNHSTTPSISTEPNPFS